MKKTYIIIISIVSFMIASIIAVAVANKTYQSNDERCTHATSTSDIVVYCKLAYDEAKVNYEKNQQWIISNSENKVKYQDKYCSKQGLIEGCLDTMGKE